MQRPWLSGIFVLIVCSGDLLFGQTKLMPGQLVRAGGVVFAPIPTDAPKTSIASVQDKHEHRMDMLWYSSMLAVAAGSTFDSASSWHKQEANGLLASGNGTFGGKAAAIKIGLLAGTLLPQILLRRNKDLRTGFTLANLAEAGVFTGVGIHNLTRTSPK
jgi:hypothetical protein